MSSAVRFRVNQPDVIFEVFDDEVVIVNLDSGNYYSLNKTGPEVWRSISQGATVEEIIESMTREYEEDGVEIETAVKQLVEELQREDIIVPDATGRESDKRPCAPVENGSGPEKLLFEAPLLHKYDDLKDLLLLDPIHEVDETGWPVKK